MIIWEKICAACLHVISVLVVLFALGSIGWTVNAQSDGSDKSIIVLP